MNRISIGLLLCAFSILFSDSIHSQIISGHISNNKKEPLPFANIFCKEINTGTTSNLDGDFIFKLPAGKRKIISSFVGYKSDTISVDLKSGETKQINIVLDEYATELQTVFVFDSQMSEADRIISTTIANKADYLSRIHNYEYMIYDKTVFSMKSKDSTMIGGLLESQSKVFFKRPDNFNEIILSKRQTKNFMPAYTNFFTMGRISNILDEEIRIDDSAIKSPLNTNAFDYYLFKMKDTTFYNNRRIFIITFEPKSKIIPLFSGEIGIIDQTYLPILFKLYGRNNVLTSARKEIEIEEKFAEFNNGLWMPVFINEKYVLNFSFPGLPPVYGNHICLLSNYKINQPDFNYQFTKNIQTEKLVSENEAKILWESNQQITLTSGEKEAVSKIDSVMENLSVFGKSFFWLVQNSFGGINDLPITSFNDFYHFNRAEGHYAGAGLKFKNVFENIDFALRAGYGFADKKTKYGFEIARTFNSIAPRLAVFNETRKQNRFYDYEVFDITYQSWFAKNDYADYYYSKGILGGVDFQLHQNLLINLQFEKRKDFSASFNSDWSLFNKKSFYNPVAKIDDGNITEYTFSLLYDNKNYYDLGFMKVPAKSESYFDGGFQISRGYFSNSSSGSYWQTHIMFNAFHQSSSWFNFSVSVRGGINTGLKLKQNLFHLPGNFGTLSTSKLFNTLFRDEYSGNKYACVFGENNFGNIIYRILGIPYLSDSKFDFIIFGKYGWIDEEPLVHASKNYYETGFGIGNLMAFLRLDFTWKLQPHSKSIFYINLLSMYDF